MIHSRNGKNGSRNQNNARNGKPKGKKFRGICNHCGKVGHEEKDCWKKHPELIPAKFAKSGAAISNEISVTNVEGLNVPVNTEHVFGFENENSARMKNNIMDLESFMNDNDDLDNVFQVKKGDDEIDNGGQVSQIEKDEMYRVCNSKKMEKALNQQSFQRKQSSRHFRETFEFAANDRQTSDTRELLDYVVRSEYEKQDTERVLKKLKRTVERTEDKIDHLTTMAEKETRRCLRKSKEEHIRKQGCQKKPMKIKRSRYRKHRARRSNGTNNRSRGMRNAHTCEKASCGYMMQELQYNKAGLAGHMSYGEFLLVTSQKKASMDRLD